MHDVRLAGQGWRVGLFVGVLGVVRLVVAEHGTLAGDAPEGAQVAAHYWSRSEPFQYPGQCGGADMLMAATAERMRWRS
jgi:hypothetical protein